MISTKEYEALYEILNVKEDTVERVFEKFSRLFPSENNYNTFRGCFTLSHLLRLNLLTKLQRLLAIFLIYETYRSEGIKKNPFGGILFEIYNKSVDHYEKKFVAEILIDNKRDKYFKLKIDVLNEEAEVFAQTFRPREEMEALEKGWIEACPKMPITQSSEIHNVVHANTPKQRKSPIPQQPMNKDLLREQEINHQSFAANYLRPLPQFLEVKHSDLYWLSPGVVHDISWDVTYQKAAKSAKVKALLIKAESLPLQIDEAMELSKIIQEYPTIFWADFNVEKIQELSNNNPYMAGQVFCKLINHPKFQMFLSKFLNMKISTNSLHVMTLFITKCRLPNVIIEYYLNGIINQCLQMQTNSQTEKLANLISILGKKCVQELKWADPKQLQQKAKKLLEKFSKSQLVANFVSLLI